jgi:hypothetical protein
MLIAWRECGYGDVVPKSCMDKVRDTVDAPSVWTALWHMRRFYADLILLPPEWFLLTAAIGIAAWYLISLRRTGQPR